MSESRPFGPLRANPESEDFGGKYEESNPISVALLRRYFATVDRLTRRAVSLSGEPGNVLEIGCGEGHSTRLIRAMLPAAADFQASEFVAAQVAIAAENNQGVSISHEDIYSLRREDSSIDLIYLLEVLEHLDEPAAGLAEIRRVLRPSGCLILGVPREPLWRVLNMARLKYVNHLGNTPGHLQHWSSRSIKRLVEIEFGPVSAVTTPIPWTILLARRC